MTVAAKRDAPHVRFRETGYWLDKTVDQILTEAVAKAPDKVAILADRADREQAPRLTYKELERLADRAASSLLRLGVGRGDVVTVQLPNWWEFVVTAFACSKIGAVINPVMPILRERELVYILNFCQAKVFIVPKTYRGFDYAAMAQGMRGDLPNLKHVIVVDGEGEGSFERTLLASEAGQPPSGLGPDDMAVLMFTSGTTGEPKGVMHTSNSLIACCKALSGRFGLDSSDVLLVASPVGHMTGYAAIVLLSVYLGGTMILQDVWEARHGVSLMAQRRRHLYRGLDAVPQRYLRDCEGRRAPSAEPAFVPVRRRANSVRLDRARRQRTRSQSVLALGHDRSAVRNAHRAFACGGEVGEHGWSATGRNGSPYRRSRRQAGPHGSIGTLARSRRPDVQRLLQAA